MQTRRAGRLTACRIASRRDGVALTRLVLLLFFVAGVFLGLVAAFSTVFRLRRQLAQFRKDAAAASDAGPEARTVADPSAVAAAPRAVVLPPHGD